MICYCERLLSQPENAAQIRNNKSRRGMLLLNKFCMYIFIYKKRKGVFLPLPILVKSVI